MSARRPAESARGCSGTAAVIAPLVAVAALCARDPGLLMRAGRTGVALGGVYLILAVVDPDLVGLGDVYLAALLGLLLGTGSLSGVVVGALAPYLVSAPITAIRLALGQVKRRSQVPLGVGRLVSIRRWGNRSSSVLSSG